MKTSFAVLMACAFALANAHCRESLFCETLGAKSLCFVLQQICAAGMVHALETQTVYATQATMALIVLNVRLM